MFKQSHLFRLVLVWVAFVVLLFFGTGRWALAPIAWLAPLPGLVLVHRYPKRAGLPLVFAATALASGAAWWGAVPLPPPVYAAFMVLNALAATLPYLAERLLVPRPGSSFATTLVFPLTATAVDYLLLSDGPLGSFGAQAYTQLGILPLAQLASATGLWGITFVVSWCAAVVFWAGSRYRAGRPFARGVALYAALVLLVGAWGAWRLWSAAPAAVQVPIVALTETRVDMGELMELWRADRTTFVERTRARHAAYLQRTDEAARSGARVVLWPELAGVGQAGDVDVLVERGLALAREHQLYLAMPLFSIDPTGAAVPVNRIVVAGPEGSIVLDHVKYGGNLLEGTLAGSRDIKTVQTPFGLLSAVICWDTDFPAVVRQAGRQGVAILLSPARVWPEVAAIHADMAAFRAIENGMTVVRHSDNGISAVLDPYGRFVERHNFAGQDNTMLRTAAPIIPARTLYPLVGDMVGQLSVAGVLLCVVLVLAQRKRIRETRRE